MGSWNDRLDLAILLSLVYILAITFAAEDLDLSTLTTSKGFAMASGGNAVSGGFDINNDGFDDIINGVYWLNSNAGVAYIVFGKEGATNSDLATFQTGMTTGFRVLGAAADDQCGFSVSKAGDVNGDNIDDVIIGARWVNHAPSGRNNAGVSYVIFGRTVTSVANAFADIQLTNVALPAGVGFRILGAAGNDNSGRAVGNAGDVNGDGIDDVIVGALNGDPPSLGAGSNAGIAHVVFGKDMTGISTPFGDVDLSTVTSGSTLGFRILGAAIDDKLGFSVASAGDINHDGWGDVIVGAVLADSSGLIEAGIVYVVFGRRVTASAANAFNDIQLPTTAMDPNIGFRIIGAAAGDNTGWSVSCAGDINGDNIDDVIIGAQFADPAHLGADNNAGISYVIFGRNIATGGTPFTDIYLSSMATSPTTGFRIIGAAAGDNSGFSVSTTGDINGDGVSEVIVGAYMADPTALTGNAGIAYVVFGRRYVYANIYLVGIVTGSRAGFRILGAALDDQTGYTVSAAGDVNNDGFGDVIVGTLQRSSYIIYGSPVSPTSQPSSQPSCQPSTQPTRQPLRRPSSQPSRQPSGQPSAQPSSHPSSQPSGQPSRQPSRQPTTQPSRQPSSQPSSQPSAQPSSQPSRQPTRQPSRQPSTQPTNHPSAQPSCQPTSQPTRQPSEKPSGQPSAQPSQQPTSQPSARPSCKPSNQPSCQPSCHPSCQPSRQPSMQPAGQPSSQPTAQPRGQPSNQPSQQPSLQPSEQPNIFPTAHPSSQPTLQPTTQPSEKPSGKPSCKPSAQPTAQPSAQSSVPPSSQPSAQPTKIPSEQPTGKPSMQPTSSPTAMPSVQPSSQPTVRPSLQPSSRPSCVPSAIPTTQPSRQPSAQPINRPTAQPSLQPSLQPVSEPSGQPSSQPTALPTVQPSAQPSLQPFIRQSSFPTQQPSSQPSHQPSVKPSVLPSAQPSSFPSRQPSRQPSTEPSAQPTSQPSYVPSDQPSTQPSVKPSLQPSQQPLAVPTSQPSSSPSLLSTYLPAGIWVSSTGGVNIVNQLAMVNNSVWICGSRAMQGACSVVNADTGSALTDYIFPWLEITSAMEVKSIKRMVVGGMKGTESSSANSEVAICDTTLSGLFCDATSFQDVVLNVESYVPYLSYIVYVGSYGANSLITILDVAMRNVRSFVYTFGSLNSVVLTKIESPPSFVGSFVACTGVSSNGLGNYIVVGMVRSDSGKMTAVYFSPISESILNSAELVNAMVLEHTHPHAFIAGGLQLNDGAGTQAYLLCVDPLLGVFSYGMRYVLNSSVADDRTRRLSGVTVSFSSVIKGVALQDTNLYMTSDLTEHNSKGNTNTSVVVLKVDMQTGLIKQQVLLSSPHASLSCTEIAVANTAVVISCRATYNASFAETIVTSSDLQLSFLKLPTGFTRSIPLLLQAEPVVFRASKLNVVSKTTHIETERYVFTTGAGASAARPTVVPTLKPSLQPSSAPSGQPSSSPTSAPSVSPQPTSQPSSSGPTNTYKPTVQPTQQPSAAPSILPTRSPSMAPSISPTVQPSTTPSTVPTAQPSLVHTIAPTRTPSAASTRKPSTPPSVYPTPTPSFSVSLLAQVVTPRRKKDNIALVIGGSVLSGLCVLWCGWRLMKWHAQRKEKQEKVQEMRAQLEVIQNLLSNHQRRSRKARSRDLSSESAVVDAYVNSGASIKPQMSISVSSASDNSSIELSSLHSSEISHDDGSDSVYSDEESIQTGDYSSRSMPLSSNTSSRARALEEGSHHNSSEYLFETYSYSGYLSDIDGQYHEDNVSSSTKS